MMICYDKMIFCMIIGEGVSTWAKITFGVLGGSIVIALILPVIVVALYRLGRPVN